MITKAHVPWYRFYYIMVGGAMIELAFGTWAFWTKTGLRYRIENPRQTDSKGGRTREAVKNKVTLLCAGFIFCYTGSEGLSYPYSFSIFRTIGPKLMAASFL